MFLKMVLEVFIKCDFSEQFYFFALLQSLLCSEEKQSAGSMLILEPLLMALFSSNARETSGYIEA